MSAERDHRTDERRTDLKEISVAVRGLLRLEIRQHLSEQPDAGVHSLQCAFLFRLLLLSHLVLRQDDGADSSGINWDTGGKHRNPNLLDHVLDETIGLLQIFSLFAL